MYESSTTEVRPSPLHALNDPFAYTMYWRRRGKKMKKNLQKGAFSVENRRRPRTSLFLMSLPKDVDEAELREIFGRHGAVKDVLLSTSLLSCDLVLI
jgi:hypothetical protein